MASVVHSYQEFLARPTKNNPVIGKEILFIGVNIFLVCCNSERKETASFLNQSKYIALSLSDSINTITFNLFSCNFLLPEHWFWYWISRSCLILYGCPWSFWEKKSVFRHQIGRSILSEFRLWIGAENMYSELMKERKMTFYLFCLSW